MADDSNQGAFCAAKGDPCTNTHALTPMPVGYNLPWARDDFGFNFGPNPNDLTMQVPLWQPTLPGKLAILKSLGVSVVRWFILANGWNYGPAPIASWQPPLGWGWSFDPPDPVDSRFASFFEVALQVVQQAGLQLIPSLVSFEFFGRVPDAYDASGNVTTGPASTAPFNAGGRADIALDPAKTETFLKTMLDPLLTISAKSDYSGVIYAWEVMNEPIQTLSRHMTGAYLDTASLSRFLQAGLDHIQKFNLPSTVGHRFITDLQKYPTGTKPQFHYYAHNLTTDDPGDLPTQPAAFLGEFGSTHDGQRNPGLLEVNPGAMWPELNGADKSADQVVYQRLVQLRNKHYSLALVWPDLDKGEFNAAKDEMNLSKTKQDQIKRFTSGN
jgi:hypothetical protein